VEAETGLLIKQCSMVARKVIVFEKETGDKERKNTVVLP
jgi:hypothetical protein